jgi:hypothetical protein
MAALRRDRSALRLLPTVLPAILVVGVIALVHADTAQDAQPGHGIVNRAQPRHPVAAAAADLFSNQEVQLSDLRARIESTTDPDAVLHLEREFQRVKLQTELDFLRLQLEHARSVGNAPASVQLEEAVVAMERLIERDARAHITDGSADPR